MSPRTPIAPGTITQTDWLDGVQTLAPASIDLVYVDPPFATGKTQRGRSGTYDDAWPSLDAWVLWLGERLIATRPLLKNTGSILLHVDWRTSHRARVVLDEVFGPESFVNHLVWAYGLGGSSPRRFARKHDDILFYAAQPEQHYFEPPRVPATSRRLRGQTKKATDVIDLPAADVLRVPTINNMALERTGYPTQKPLALLTLLIEACCPPGGLVLDPCCGSGTTLLAAQTTARRWIGLDRSPEAVAIARQRCSTTTPA